MRDRRLEKSRDPSDNVESLAQILPAVLHRNRIRPAAPNGPHTALVDVRGEIAPDTEASAELLIGALRQAFEDTGAQAVVVRINSPGGSPVQAGHVNDEIRRLRQKYPSIPVHDTSCTFRRRVHRFRGSDRDRRDRRDGLRPRVAPSARRAHAPGRRHRERRTPAKPDA